MIRCVNRRWVTIGVTSAFFASGVNIARAQDRLTWSAQEAHDALASDRGRVIDVRTREEWRETGVGSAVWPISMHEDRFSERLFAAKELAGDRKIGLICATGGRSSYLQRALTRAGYEGYFDISEGMLGSRSGKGWLAIGLPVVEVDAALTSLPEALR